MTDLIALAERVEREPPSRELDCRIAAALFPEAAERIHHPSATFNVVGIHTEGETWASNYPVPPYTNSLDAAVTLVPKGRGFVLRSYGDGAGSAIIADPPRDVVRGVACVGGTIAAALTAACLRARAALQRMRRKAALSPPRPKRKDRQDRRK